MALFTNEGSRLIYRNNGEKMIVEPWGANSLRVRVSMQHAITDDRYALLDPAPCAPTIEINEYNAYITNGNITAKLAFDGWAQAAPITFYNQRGEVLLEERGGHGALMLRPHMFEPIIGGDFQLTASFESNPTEKLYGMGQYQQDIFDLKNCVFELAHRNSQASIPFVTSSLGYGFLWHNPAIGRATFGKNTTQWYAASTRQLDYWITAGNSPAEITEAYMTATGKPPMMPEYGLGFWQCKLRYWNQEQLLNVAREYKRRNLPIDVIVCDFFHWPKMGDYRFDPEFFPDPKAMVDELKAMGIELMVSVWPQVSLESENYDEMRQMNLLVLAEKGMPIGMRFQGDSMFYDATNPEAREYVWQKCKQNYYDNGIKVFWLDEAEPEYAGYDFTNYRYHMGTNAQIGNIYPQQYAKGFYEGMTAAGQRNVVNLVRCAWAGSSRYGALVWSGDIHSTWQDLRNQIVAGLHMGIAGIPWWTTDIGGFHGGWIDSPEFRELLIRWFQYGTFCPVMRLHGDRKPSEEARDSQGRRYLDSGADNEVWSFGEQAAEILPRYMRLREAMRPYTRELMRAAHERGLPVIRTMFYEFPNQAACWDISDQFMFGPDVLVAPVIEPGAVRREVYLPGGAEWTALHSGQKYAGGQTICADAPLDAIPAFLRDGAHSEWIGMI